MKRVICPECASEGEKSRSYFCGTLRTAMAGASYYDENGDYHDHDPNVSTTSYSCSRGHRWTTKTTPECWCGWPKEEGAKEKMTLDLGPNFYTPPLDAVETEEPEDEVDDESQTEINEPCILCRKPSEGYVHAAVDWCCRSCCVAVNRIIRAYEKRRNGGDR